MSARDQIEALSRPSAPGAFALGLELCRGCRLAVTHEGFVALAIAVPTDGSSNPRHLVNLVYDPPRELEVVTSDGGRRVETFATLICRTKEPAIEDAFLRISLALLDSAQGGLSEADLERRLDELVSLFRALNQPATQTIQGLWCELAVVVWSSDPRVALSAWHSSPRALHDFASGADRLEVKSCGTGLREHALRLEQLQEAPGGRTILASVLVDETEDDGETVADLVEQIGERVERDKELKRRLETIVTHSLGRDWREAASRRFSLERARSSLRLYDARDVPTIPMPIPTAVKHVSFTVDLSDTNDLPLEEARSRGSFFVAVLHRAT